jgi:hypothetical protein
MGEMVGLRIMASIGDYRAGRRGVVHTHCAGDHYAHALNRDVLFPRPGGRFLFGRLIGREGDRLQILPLIPNARQQILTDPPWAAVATKLLRGL